LKFFIHRLPHLFKLLLIAGLQGNEALIDGGAVLSSSLR